MPAVVPSPSQLVSHCPAERASGRASTWSPQDDVPLVRAAQSGQAASFDVLYRRHARIVHAVLLGRSTREDIEDLVQDVFLTAWRQLATLRDPAAFAGWVVTIARHQRIDHVRRQASGMSHASAAIDEARETRVESVDRRRVPPEEIASPDASADHRLEARRALDAIRTLPEAYRETLVLRLVEGMTGPEIATRTGLTPESVRVNLCRGMKLLREAIQQAPAARTR